MKTIVAVIATGMLWAPGSIQQVRSRLILVARKKIISFVRRD